MNEPTDKENRSNNFQNHFSSVIAANVNRLTQQHQYSKQQQMATRHQQSKMEARCDILQKAVSSVTQITQITQEFQQQQQPQHSSRTKLSQTRH